MDRHTDQQDSRSRSVPDRPPGLGSPDHPASGQDGETRDCSSAEEVPSDQRKVRDIEVDRPRQSGLDPANQDCAQVSLHADSHPAEVRCHQADQGSQRQTRSPARRDGDRNSRHRCRTGFRHTGPSGGNPCNMEKLENDPDLKSHGRVSENGPGENSRHQRTRNHELTQRGRVEGQNTPQSRE